MVAKSVRRAKILRHRNTCTKDQISRQRMAKEVEKQIQSQLTCSVLPKQAFVSLSIEYFRIHLISMIFFLRFVEIVVFTIFHEWKNNPSIIEPRS